MEEIQCAYCGKKFKRKRSQILLAIKHYCSFLCARNGSRKGKIVKCFNCKKEIYKPLKDLKKSKSKKYFCSRFCGNTWIGSQKRGSSHPNWTNGEYSYKYIMKRNGLLRECFLCVKNDQRILIVHHLDKNRKNNKIKNLACLCQNCHFLIHHYREVQENFNKKRKHATSKM